MNSFDLFGNPIEPGQLGEDTPYDAPGFVLPHPEMEEVVEDEQKPARNFWTLSACIIATAIWLFLQCFNLQIRQGSVNRALAEGNSIRVLTTQADRGLITDINGNVLAQNSRQLALAIDPQTLPASLSERQKTYQLLKEKAGISDDTIRLIEENRLKSPDPFPIKTNLQKDESLLYQEWFASVPGVIMQEIPIRNYQNFPSAGQLLGYVGSPSEQDTKNGIKPDQRVGKAGIEESYDSTLGGTPGLEKVEVNALGQEVRQLPAGPDSQPKTGATLKLSIDLRLQQIMATALENELARRTKKFGDLKDLGASAVAIDPSTGAIRAMVSLPDYNDQLFAQGISQQDYQTLLSNPANPLLNRTIQGQYPSGSVIKPMIAAAALQSGVISPTFKIDTPPAIRIGTFTFPDWKDHGLTDIRRAIAESNDIFFYGLGGGWPEGHMKGMGIDTMNSYLNEFGLGNPTGVDLPGEVGGLLGSPSWKQKVVGEPWYIGDTYHSSIGQGYTLVTPLQMAVSTAAVANGGTVWKPQLGWSTTDPETGKETLLPHTVLKKDFISPTNIQIVREGMRMTVTDGSARPLNTLTVTSAGKTGTAEFIKDGQTLTHAWYTGFAPYDNPEIAFAIMIEGGGESFYSSEPVAEEILRGYFNDPLAPGQHLNSEPDLDNPAVLSQFQGEH